jgi:hypothetical protein
VAGHQFHPAAARRPAHDGEAPPRQPQLHAANRGRYRNAARARRRGQ